MAVASGPVYVGSGTRVDVSSATTITGNLPTLANSHGLLIARVSIASNATISTATSGWTKLYQDNSGVSLTQGIWIAAGNAAAPVFTWSGAVNGVAIIDFYDDPSNPVETAVIGANSTVGTGSGTTISSASNNSTRDYSVFITATTINSNSVIGASTNWTQNNRNNAANFTIETSQRQITTSGSASGATSQTASVTGTWVQRQIELLLQVLPTGLYTTEIEIAPLMQISDGFKVTEVEVAPLMQISDGFKASEVEIAPLMQISDGFKAAEVEVVALLVPGTEPPYVPPKPQVSKLKAWTFSLDGHDMYVLRLGDDSTIVYDLTTQKWAQWDSFNRPVWRGGVGMIWLGMNRAGYTAGAGSNIVVGDDTYGLLWTLDPTSGLDASPTNGADPEQFPRAVIGGIPMRGRISPRNNSVFLTASVGDPDFTGATVKLEISDDNGRTFEDCGDITLEAGNYFTELEWRSLGLIRAPGRVFRFTDTGAAVRIDGADARLSPEDPDV